MNKTAYEDLSLWQGSEWIEEASRASEDISGAKT